MLEMELQASYMQAYSEKMFLKHEKAAHRTLVLCLFFLWDSSQHSDKLESNSELKFQTPKAFNLTPGDMHSFIVLFINLKEV